LSAVLFLPLLSVLLIKLLSGDKMLMDTGPDHGLTVVPEAALLDVATLAAVPAVPEAAALAADPRVAAGQ